MKRTISGRIPTRERLAKHARLRAHMAWQLDHAPDCETCGIDCGGRCARDVGAHTEIRLCESCGRFQPVPDHSPSYCAAFRALRAR